jgi:hypothetical protein
MNIARTAQLLLGAALTVTFGCTCPQRALTPAQQERLFLHVVDDFRQSGEPIPLLAASGNVVVLLLPVSADPLLKEGRQALPTLQKFSTSRSPEESRLAEACMLIIQAKKVSRSTPHLEGADKVKMVSYAVLQ